jgi:hypothetical protein
MLQGDDLSIQLFIFATAITFLSVGITQAGWTHRAFVLSMFAFSGLLFVAAVFWREIGPYVQPIDHLMFSIASSRYAWFILGVSVATVIASRIASWPRGSHLRVSLPLDPQTSRPGLQTFPNITYIQVAVAAAKRLSRCRAFITEVSYRQTPDEPFALQNNERHYCRWSRPLGETSPYEVDIIPAEPPIRLNVCIYTAAGLEYEREHATPSNIIQSLQRVGNHRFKIVFNWGDRERHKSAAYYTNGGCG